jgi:hypothetical protein
LGSVIGLAFLVVRVYGPAGEMTLSAR